MRFSKIISTFFGIGYIKKGGGTVAAAVACLVWYFVALHYANWNHLLLQSAVILLIFVAGIWSGNKVETVWGKDSYRVVLDEVLGMCVALFAVSVQWQTCLAALILFRIFDIFKPLYIKKTEDFPGGWGVMLDDVLAGIYANILLQIFFLFITPNLKW